MGLFSRLFRRNRNGSLEYKDDIKAVSTERAETRAQEFEANLEAGEILDREPVFDPDIPELWHDIRESKKRHICRPYTEETLAETEKALGHRLPESYKALMKLHNGGLVNKCRVKMPKGIEERLVITELFGIGSDAPYSLCGRFGSAFITEAYRHNRDIGIAIANTLLPGRGVVFLDYRRCLPDGEPCVTYSDSVAGTETVIARSFAAFVMGLSENTIVPEQNNPV